jgi:GMP synthase (glutamine-hydrolysing)
MTFRPRGLFIEHQADAHPGYLGDRAVERGADVVVHRADAGPFPDPTDFDFVIPLGSGDSAYDDSLPYAAGERGMLERAIDHDVPVFGVCFGGQMLARALGGTVERMSRPEIGWARVETTDPSLVESGPWLVWHFDAFTPPPDATLVARTDLASQAFTFGPHLGVQFHPEATVGSVSSWARTYADAIVAHGGDVEEINAETRRRAAAARAAAHRLFDRFLDRALATAKAS